MLAGLGVALGTLAGCTTTHEVTIDAISNSTRPMGASYRLEVHDPSGGVEPAVSAQAIARAKDALAARGLYEAPANAKPDNIINLEYGVGQGQIKIIYRSRAEETISPLGLQKSEPYAKPVLVYEKYIQLSAREPVADDLAAPAPRARPKKRGDELWNVRVSVEDPKKDLAPYLPVLASAAVDYLGRNTGKEVHISVEAEKAAGTLRPLRPLPKD
ncbi:MAG: hypothetical protein HYX71_13520 [Opitutae bacterium]|nr:hypothetical protein [Opitutae bacterium]